MGNGKSGSIKAAQHVQNQKKRRARYIKEGKCICCGKPSVTKRHCDKHRREHNEISKQRNNAMARYKKITLQQFEKNVRGGKYDTRTGARRAMGKICEGWLDKDQVRMAKLIDELLPGPARKVHAPKKADNGVGRTAFQVHQLSINFLEMEHRERLAVLTVLDAAKDTALSVNDLWRLLKVSDEKLRKK